MQPTRESPLFQRNIETEAKGKPRVAHDLIRNTDIRCLPTMLSRSLKLRVFVRVPTNRNPGEGPRGVDRTDCYARFGEHIRWPMFHFGRDMGGRVLNDPQKTRGSDFSHVLDKNVRGLCHFAHVRDLDPFRRVSNRDQKHTDRQISIHVHGVSNCAEQVSGTGTSRRASCV